MDELGKALRENRVALIVLVGGTAVLAIVLADRVTQIAGGAVETVQDLTRRVLSSGFIAAAILVAASLLGAPVWIAVTAAGLYLGASAAGKAFAALAASSTGTAGTGSAAGSRELAELLCSAHGGVQTELSAGGLTVLSCRDGKQFRLESGG